MILTYLPTAIITLVVASVIGVIIPRLPKLWNPRKRLIRKARADGLPIEGGALGGDVQVQEICAKFALAQRIGGSLAHELLRSGFKAVRFVALGCAGVAKAQIRNLHFPPRILSDSITYNESRSLTRSAFFVGCDAEVNANERYGFHDGLLSNENTL